MNDNSERAFLHSVATPLATALLCLDIIAHRIENNNTANPQTPELIEKIKFSLKKINDLLDKRRTALVSQSGDK